MLSPTLTQVIIAVLSNATARAEPPEWFVWLLIGIVALLIIGFAMLSHYVKRAAKEGNAIIYTSRLDVVASVVLPVIMFVINFAVLLSLSGQQEPVPSWHVLLLSISPFVLYFVLNIVQAIRWNDGYMAAMVAVYRIMCGGMWLGGLFLMMLFLTPSTVTKGKAVKKTAVQMALSAGLAWGIWRSLKGNITPPD